MRSFWAATPRLTLMILLLTVTGCVEQRARWGNSDAQYALGWMYEQGDDGFRQDTAEAFKWWRKAAEQGHGASQRLVALAYENGRGVRRDYAEALKWYRKAADQPNQTAAIRADAFIHIGKLYEGGKGVSTDATEALRWFRKAAELGDEGARHLVNMAAQEKGR